jgi:pyruvate/2-oxoacid:ferredoxin oxidoreductase alpha subunit
MSKKLVKGNEAVIYGALLGGVTHFFGYPITPASEIAHAAARYLPEAGRVFLQAESEVSSINMVYGAASAGARAMTASSGPGISLMAEGISYIAGAELPCVIVDIQRAGPGLGNIWPEQGDYNMVVKGGGHGNYRNIVFAPNSVQEMCDFTYRAFDIADEYRVCVFILSDAYIGQMMEPIQFQSELKNGNRKPWAVYADAESRDNLITSIFMNQKIQSDHNIKLQKKYHKIEKELLEYEEFYTEDAEVIVVSFGITSRICLTAAQKMQDEGYKVGLLRPKTLFPFPFARIGELGEQAGTMIAAELNNGQMADDVERAVYGRVPVLRYNWYGGIVPTTKEIIENIKRDCYG